MSKISTTLAIALIIISGVLGVLLGSYSNPEYKANMYDKSEMDFGRVVSQVFRKDCPCY